MLVWISIFLLFGSISVYGEQPRFICENHKPFKTNENSCADYNEICIKTGDPDCLNFRSACNQCPPSNYSILMYMDVMNMKSQINTTKIEMGNLAGQIQNNAKRTNTMISLLIAIIVMNIILVLLLIFEIKFNVIGRCVKIRKKYKEVPSQSRDVTDLKTNSNSIDIKFYFETFENLLNDKCKEIVQSQSDLKGQFENLLNAICNEIVQSQSDFKETFENLLNDKCNEIVQSQSDLKEKVQFQVDGNEKIIKINISPTDTVVKVKRSVCEQILGRGGCAYKFMNMKYKEKLLEDNKCFNDQIPPQTDVIIKCKFDETKKSKGILVLRVQDYNEIVKFYQFYKYQSVQDVMKTILLDKAAEAIMLKNRKKLANNKTLANCELEDESLLTLIKRERRRLIMNSEFVEDQKISVDYYTTDPIKNILINIANQMNTKIENLVLFIGRSYLDMNKYLYEYEEGRSVQICIKKKFADVEIKKPIYCGHLYEFYEALDKIKNETILIKKYKTNKRTLILKELATFQITKFCPRFIQILNVYNDDSSEYVAIENMPKGIMAEYLKENTCISSTLIRKWSRQILEGLKFLHENDTIVRDLNPTSILIDADDNVKLFNFNFSKYTEYCKPTSSFEKPEFSCYLAPEIINQMLYDASVDIWSFGAIVIKMESGKEISLSLDIVEASKNRSNNITLQYKLSNSNTPQIKDFIDSCMKVNPTERVYISQLISHSFIA